MYDYSRSKSAASKLPSKHVLDAMHQIDQAKGGVYTEMDAIRNALGEGAKEYRAAQDALTDILKAQTLLNKSLDRLRRIGS